MEDHELVYPGTPGVMKLVTKDSPVNILSEDFPKHNWPISGGWGYTMEDAVVIELSNPLDGVNFEYKFLQYRTFEEGIVFRPKPDRLAGFQFSNVNQALIHGRDGRLYDRLSMDVAAYKNDDFESLKSDWESHRRYKFNPIGKARHKRLANSLKINYTVTAWFDITRFYK